MLNCQRVVDVGSGADPCCRPRWFGNAALLVQRLRAAVENAVGFRVNTGKPSPGFHVTTW